MGARAAAAVPQTSREPLASARDRAGLGSLIHSFSAAGSPRPRVLRGEAGRGGGRERGSFVLGGGREAEGGGLGPPALLPGGRCAPS